MATATQGGGVTPLGERGCPWASLGSRRPASPPPHHLCLPWHRQLPRGPRAHERERKDGRATSPPPSPRARTRGWRRGAHREAVLSATAAAAAAVAAAGAAAGWSAAPASRAVHASRRPRRGGVERARSGRTGAGRPDSGGDTGHGTPDDVRDQGPGLSSCIHTWFNRGSLPTSTPPKSWQTEQGILVLGRVIKYLAQKNIYRLSSRLSSQVKIQTEA